MADQPKSADYVCPQCGPDPSGGTAHQERMHLWPPGLNPIEPGTVDTWWPASSPDDALVNMVVLGVAHHLATGHDGGGGGDVYSCEGCDFIIDEGRVLAGGWVRFKADEVPRSDGTVA